MKTGRTWPELAAEIERQATTKRDLIAPAQMLQLRPDGDDVRLYVGGDRGYEAGPSIGPRSNPIGPRSNRPALHVSYAWPNAPLSR